MRSYICTYRGPRRARSKLPARYPRRPLRLLRSTLHTWRTPHHAARSAALRSDLRRAVSERYHILHCTTARTGRSRATSRTDRTERDRSTTLHRAAPRPDIAPPPGPGGAAPPPRARLRSLSLWNTAPPRTRLRSLSLWNTAPTCATSPAP